MPNSSESGIRQTGGKICTGKKQIRSHLHPNAGFPAKISIVAFTFPRRVSQVFSDPIHPWQLIITAVTLAPKSNRPRQIGFDYLLYCKKKKRSKQHACVPLWPTGMTSADPTASPILPLPHTRLSAHTHA